jgi:hypothetical protein
VVIEIQEKEVFDGSLLISIAGKQQRISKQIAQNLYINIKDTPCTHSK